MKKTLLVMAAGLGSRYGGVKQMAGVGPNGEILMEYAIFDALKAGFNDIVIIIKPEMLSDCREKFGNRIEAATGIKIKYATQSIAAGYKGADFPAGRTKPLGTVHAVLCAKEYLQDGAFVAINADDYYGREAIEKIAGELDSLDRAAASTMVAYQLKNTVSPFGTVTRGVCMMEDGWLSKVNETYKIKLESDGSIWDTSGDQPVRLDGGSAVSMNMWGYNSGVLELMDNYFEHFLAQLRPDDNKSECLLPIMMDEMIEAGLLATSVLNTSDVWFGLTYQEDRAGVQKALVEMHNAGFYPARLWNKGKVK